MLHQKAGFQGLGVIEIQLRPFFEREVNQVAVIGVVVDDGDGGGAKATADLLYHRGFSRAGGTGKDEKESREFFRRSGIHGANRLASNSLLEAVVYARRVAQDIRSSSNKLIEATTPAQLPEPIHLRDANLNNTVAMIRRLMARRVGIARNEDDLRAAIARLDNACPELAGIPGEISNLLLVARLVALAALRRKESRGAHYRHDYPLPVPGLQYAQYLTVDALLETI